MIETYERNVQYSYVLVYHRGDSVHQEQCEWCFRGPVAPSQTHHSPRALPVEIPQGSCDITGT